MTTTPTHVDGYIRWLRAQVGHELIYLVYTTALVFNEEGLLLVQDRYDFDWLSVPGGALEMHESLTDCVKREVFEETGITCEVEQFLGVFSHPQYNLLYPNGDRVQPWTAAFACRVRGEAKIQVDGQETLKARFQPVHEVRHRLPLMYQDMLTAYETQQVPHLEKVYFGNELKPYYPILREKVGHQRVILPGATAVIYNDQGQVLTVHEKKHDLWGLPAGFADLGESSSATIVREIKEETGLEVEPVRVLGIYSEPSLVHTEFPNRDLVHLIDLIIECRIIGGEIRCDKNEVDGVEFRSLEALNQNEASPLRRQLHNDLMNQNFPFVR